MRKYLEDMRKKLNLSQQDVAEKIGISRQYYNAIERGERQKKMEITLVSKLSDVLDISMQTIIEEESKIFS